MKIRNWDITLEILLTLWRTFHYISVTFLRNIIAVFLLRLLSPQFISFLNLCFSSTRCPSLPFLWFQSFYLLHRDFSPCSYFLSFALYAYVIWNIFCSITVYLVVLTDPYKFLLWILREFINVLIKILQYNSFITSPRRISIQDTLNVFITVMKTIICTRIYMLHVL